MAYKILSLQPPGVLNSSAKIFTFKISKRIFPQKLRGWNPYFWIFIRLSDMLFQMNRSKLFFKDLANFQIYLGRLPIALIISAVTLVNVSMDSPVMVLYVTM